MLVKEFDLKYIVLKAIIALVKSIKLVIPNISKVVIVIMTVINFLDNIMTIASESPEPKI